MTAMTWNFKMKFHTFLWKSYPPLTATISFPVGGGGLKFALFH